MSWKKERLKKLQDIIITTQFFAIILITMAIFTYFRPHYLNNIVINHTFYLLFFLVMLVAGILYFENTFRNDKNLYEEKILNYSSILNLILFILTTIIVYLTKQSETFIFIEFLYILPVLTISISHGLNYGLFFSAVVSVNVLFFNNSYLELNDSLEATLLFIGILFLSAWLSGSFTELEKSTRSNLESLTNIDKLTGLSNHKHFQEVLKNVLENKHSYSEVSLILADMDYFKFYNDSFGHTQGDRLLKEVGQIIDQTVPTDCTPARYGGDEFAIILPGYTDIKAKEIAEKIRLVVEQTSFYGEKHIPHNNITISLGVSSTKHNSRNSRYLIDAADKALYNSKYTNNNKVTFYFSILNNINESINKEQQGFIYSLKTLLTIIDAKDRYTYGHSERVANLSVELAQNLGIKGQELENLKIGAFLHDIGKIEVDRSTLTKHGKLDETEWEIMKNHTVYGGELAAAISRVYNCSDIIRSHHENLDGSGYPDGLKGDEIPFGAKILRIVDSFDAMTTKRPYRPNLTVEKALEELYRYKGIYYDPKILHVFSELICKYPEYRKDHYANAP
ncbi:diguanylate cyclase [Natranaerobius trueperi]|uniref:Diguanylate cyclase n=1 Tax=Natranaerobius trueperi TaxID=759412 RepID=A0A226C104_9FIRM|nr:diguanylate cyclase [Natranaerobius trueperi]OWZ84865.1 hypothetical protein CDO51_00205 [Natranaerobius trueperi]